MTFEFGPQNVTWFVRLASPSDEQTFHPSLKVIKMTFSFFAKKKNLNEKFGESFTFQRGKNTRQSR